MVSNIGSWMQDVGESWLMTSLTLSPLLVALGGDIWQLASGVGGSTGRSTTPVRWAEVETTASARTVIGKQ